MAVFGKGKGIIIKFVFFLVLVMSFSACSGSRDKSMVSAVESGIPVSPTDTSQIEKPYESPPLSETTTPTPEVDPAHTPESPSTPTPYPVDASLGQFISELGYDSEILLELEDDINLDDADEIVVLLDSQQVLVLQRNKEQLKQIGMITLEDIPIVCEVSDISFVKLDKTDEKYIWIDIMLGYGGRGLIVTAVRDKKLEYLEYYAPSATGSDAATLVDSNGDGIYERVDYYGYHDFQKHVDAFYYTFDGNAFSESGKAVLYDNDEQSFIYPESAADVVQCFIMAKGLNITDELEQLVYPGKRIDLPMDSYFYINTYGLEPQKEEISINENRSVVKAHTDSEAQPPVEYVYFVLERYASQWKVSEALLEQPDF